MIYQQTDLRVRVGSGDGNKTLRGRVGMDPSPCGSRWGWIKTSRGRVGTGDGTEILSPCRPLIITAWTFYT